MKSQQRAPLRVLTALALFGASFGFVEAAVVVYLRNVFEPLAVELAPDRKPGDVFPLMTLEQLEASDRNHFGQLKIEVMREAATMVMLAAAGLAVGWNFNTFFAGFIIGFGVWDVFYYVFLKLLIDWPTSLLEWDILFLIPCPWVGPVLAPLLVAISMIACGAILMWRESADRPVRIGWPHWFCAVLGGLIIIVSFCWDFRHVMAGGLPSAFPWPVLAAGEIIGLGAFCSAVGRSH